MSTGSDWLHQARRLLDAFVETSAAPAPSAGGEESGAKATRGAECVWCPHCQAAAVVRGERTEVAVALADVLTASAAALRAFAESAESAQPAQPRPPSEPRPPAQPAPSAPTDDDPLAEPPPVVQRIEIA